MANSSDPGNVAATNAQTEGQRLINRSDQIKANRGTWEQHWQEATWYVIPRKSDVTSKTIQGAKRHWRVHDSSPIQDNEEFAASLHGMLISPTSQWFKMQHMDDALNETPAVREWFANVTKIMHRVIHDERANFTSQVDEFFLDIGSVGTAKMDVDEGEKDTDPHVTFKARHIGNFWIEENSKGIVDVTYTEIKYTKRQMEQEFPGMTFNQTQLQAAQEDPGHEFTVLHVVKPREDRDPAISTPENMPIASIWVDKDTMEILKKSGFEEWPTPVARWRKQASDTYGWSPAMNALPDIKQLNAMGRAQIRATEKLLDPPLDVPHNGYVGKIRMGPGDVNFRNRIGNERIEPINMARDLPFHRDEMNDLRDSIKRSFFLDRLRVPEDPNMTLGQVIEIRNQALRVMSPMLGRIQTELLAPLLNRVFRILFRKGLFGDPPEEIEDGTETDIIYLSRLAQAQSANEAESIVQTLSLAADIINLDPTVLDNVDMDESFLIIARTTGWPVRAMRQQEDGKNGKKGVKTLRKEREEAALAEAQRQATERGADVGLKGSQAAELESRNQ